MKKQFELPNDVKITCAGADCPERKSLCCQATSTLGKKDVESQFVCKNCRKEFQGGQCEALNRIDSLDAETLSFLSESNKIEEVHDVGSLLDACFAWEWLINQEKLTKEVILRTHKMLMKNQTSLAEKDKGVYRNGPIWVGGKEKLPWYAVPEALGNWCLRVEETISKGQFRSDKRADDIIQEDHVLYENIHPFFDGNGRTGRMFLNWQRVKMGLPILVLWSEEKHWAYYPWFRE